MSCVGIFGLKFKETIVIFEISTFEFITNKFLIHTGKFVIGFGFSKVPGSAFSEGVGPLFKVCFI